MVMYGIYNSDTLEKLISTVHKMHNKEAWNEKLFVGKLIKWYPWYLSKDRAVSYAINSLLYITTLREKYVKMYEKVYEAVKDVWQCDKITFKRLFGNLSCAPNDITGNFK